MSDLKTLIAVPCMDNVSTEFTRCMLLMTQYEAQHGTHGTIEINMRQSSLIYDARNILALHAIENDFDRVLWIDSDMAFRYDIMSSLHKHLDSGHDAATALYVKRCAPIIPVLYKDIHSPEEGTPPFAVDYLDYPRNTTFPVAGFGFGCVMMKTSLLRDVWHDYGPPFAPYVWAGEDISFCYRARLLHADMICDSSLQCGHVGVIQFTPDYYEKTRGD